MRVNIEFDRPFYGVIFSKGAYLAILLLCFAQITRSLFDLQSTAVNFRLGRERGGAKGSRENIWDVYGPEISVGKKKFFQIAFSRRGTVIILSITCRSIEIILNEAQ